MRGDQAMVGWVEAEHAHRFLRHVTVAGAVETVAADGVIAVDPHRQGIKIGCRLHGLVERRVYHGDVRNCRHLLDRMPNDKQRRRVMQGRQMAAGFDVDNNAPRDDDRGPYELATMRDTVTDCRQVTQPHAPIKLRQNRLEGSRMRSGWERDGRFPPLSVKVIDGRMAPRRSARPDSFGVLTPAAWTANFSEDDPLVNTSIRAGSPVSGRGQWLRDSPHCGFRWSGNLTLT
jgi:hypothetical protein